MITPDFLENSLVIMLVGYVIAIAFQLYVLYLNWKQSKVKDQMNELIAEVKIIKEELKKINKPKQKTKKTKRKKVS